MRTARYPSQRGFTLIELGAVVVIVGVLATLAVVAYRRQIRSAQIAEATSMVLSIREAQERVKAETGVYLDISANKDALYPAPAFEKATGWGAPCGSLCRQGRAWTNLSLTVTEPVRFGYATVAGDRLCNPSCKMGSFSLKTKPNLNTELDAEFARSPDFWYFIRASNVDKDGKPAMQVVGTSFGAALIIDDFE
jgi:prepilin-type N-terminal cleavage/methylation domain-containing protein